MIKYHRIHSYWTDKDVKYLSDHNIKIETGYDSFDLPEDNKYLILKNDNFGRNKNEIISKKLIISDSIIGIIFSTEELKKASNYVLTGFGKPLGFPLPRDSYMDKVYENYCKSCHIRENQNTPFQIATPRLSKKQVNFSLNWVFDAMFFKKEFFLEVLKPLGLKSINVILNKTGKVSEDIVQLDIPVAKSKLLIDGTAYDTEKACSACGIKKYSQQTLDIFPKFERDFDFLICKTQEFFGERETEMAYRRIIISKEFCDVLLGNKVIRFNSFNLIPMES
ncbi:hypothetical protein UMM65_06675 [Aureibaculum sp. 2210JD6-5]|uniref:hypothetical protein n=1 Tax=Aureibaculum sp. 2210JD6-5 TaxID=3103957 RepID=UPI002AAEF32C|nr:hypothetical protein [Aureibaculum sp. 2210JD6-5]MDY7394918.1 hypothetical protein [Aureibaculum sp. 2210JD6-5]